jgi:hypothetical protein
MYCSKCGQTRAEGATQCSCGFSFDSGSVNELVGPPGQPSVPPPPPTLAPHQYPLWIKLMGLAILACLATSLYQLPPYYRAGTLLNRAETLAEHGDHKSAADFFLRALEIAPSSKRVRIGLAFSYFKSSDPEDHKKALNVLEGVTIEKDDWQKLSAVMPASYRHLFTGVKE